MSTVNTLSISSENILLPSITSAKAYAWDQEHVFHSWSAQAGRVPMNIIKTAGSYVWEDTGHKLLDFSSQRVNLNLGHQHPFVVEAIREQAAKICSIAPQHANDQRSLAAKLILDHAPKNFSHVFFTNAGTEANEHAIRMAKSITGRNKIASLYRSYHGCTGNIVRTTGDARRWPSDKTFTDAVHFHGPFLYRSEFHSENESQECARALEHFEHMLQFEGPESFAAVILESIPGSVGIMVPPPGYLAGIKQICEKYGVILILDEIMAGFGRTGKWFGLDHFSVQPDLITFAKGVSSGYMPLGGVIISDKIAAYFKDKIYPGGLTYSGHPLSCAAAVATITVMEQENIIDHANSLGEKIFAPALEEWKFKHPIVGDVRGKGVFWAVELVKNKDTKEPLALYGSTSPEMQYIIKQAHEKGVMLFHNTNRIYLVPPCNITETDAKFGIEIIDDVLTTADKYAHQ